MKSMLKKALLAGFIVTLSGLMSLSAEARGERKGFMVGGNVLVGGEVADIEAFGGGIGLRIGAGLSEKLLLYFENDNFFTSKSGIFIDVSTGLAKVQYFFTDNIYANAGVGLGFFSAETNVKTGFGNVRVSGTEAGFAANIGGGYEFRITERFVIAPELSLTYAHIKGGDFFIPAAKGYFGVYF